MKLQAIVIGLILSAGSIPVSAQLEWKKYDGTIPERAVVGGYENGQNLFVCRAAYENVFHAGKMIGTNCNIGWGGEEMVVSEFEILTDNGGVRLTWERIDGTIPANAVEAGNEEGRRNYVGQAVRSEDNTLHPGKVVGDAGQYQCNYGYGGQEIVEANDYKILVASPVLEWVVYDGAMPEEAVKGGKENGSDLLLCRAEYNGASHPGKVVAGQCNIGYGGKEIVLPNFEVLINYGVPLAWEQFKGTIPKKALQGGVEKGRPLFIGQTTRPDGSIHSGKILGMPGNYLFNYGYGGQEISVKGNFRILVQR